MIGINLPKLSEYDPIRSAEGAIDPLGLYTIADRLAVRLVPGIRERMSHPRFLTAMTVGTVILRDYDEDAVSADGQSEPYLVYEWHAVEGIVRKRGDDPNLSGLPGVLKTRDCLRDRLHLSAPRYLKTPTVFGFHGVYRVLADNLNIIRDGFLDEAGYELLTAWEKEQNLTGFSNGDHGPGASRRSQIQSAVYDGMKKGSIDRSGSWDGWNFFGSHLFPNEIPVYEAQILKRLLTTINPASRAQVIQFLTSNKGQSVFLKNQSEKEFHQALRLEVDTDTKQLLDAIGIYERFCRLLQDAFDDCLAAMTEKRGKINPSALSKTNGCMDACKNVPKIFEEVADRLSSYQQSDNFEESFGALSISTNSEEWTNTLLEHHIKTQRKKPPNGKNPWFERFDDGAVVIRPGYRRTEGRRYDDSYVHAYRTKPLWSFISDLGMPN